MLQRARRGAQLPRAPRPARPGAAVEATGQEPGGAVDGHGGGWGVRGFG